MRRAISALVFAVSILTTPLVAQNRPDAPEFDTKEHYTKYEYRIPMRDGVRLFTAVYLPKDSSRAYPCLLYTSPSPRD